MIQMTIPTLNLWLGGFFSGGVILTAITAYVLYRIFRKAKEDEISELVRTVAEGELSRRKQADSIRKISIESSNLKNKIRKLLRTYNQIGKSPFGKDLKEIINGE